MSDSRFPEPIVPAGAARRWVLYGVSYEQGLLLVQCPNTLELGTVEPRSREDWHAGCKAVDYPHLWPHAHLVQPTGQVARLPYVIEDRQVLRCQCEGQCRESQFHAIPSEVFAGIEWPVGDDRGQVERLIVELKPFCGRRLSKVLRSWWRLDENFPDIGMELMCEQLEAARVRGFHAAPCVIQACLTMAVGDQDVPAELHRWNTALNDLEVTDQDGDNDSDDGDGGRDDDNRGDGDGDGDGVDHPEGNDNESADDDEYRAADDDHLELSRPLRSWRRSAQKEKVAWEMPV